MEDKLMSVVVNCCKQEDHPQLNSKKKGPERITKLNLTISNAISIVYTYKQTNNFFTVARKNFPAWFIGFEFSYYFQ